ncbi:MAG: GNAT family N-acetyltransferase [Gemmatimonadales bacterium]|nr:GNAT family N-acetyltransferase [Gemmatimonadales bacterium]
MTFDLQPTLISGRVHLRPLRAADLDALFAVASDPLIWEQHPDKSRSTPEGFRRFFEGAMDSGGALLATDAATGAVIGSSRYAGLDTVASEVEIGWTFLARAHWGGHTNAEMKQLMLRHAFQYVASVVFRIDPANVRSQRAAMKIGAVRIEDRTDPTGRVVWVYRIMAEAWSPPE